MSATGGPSQVSPAETKDNGSFAQKLNANFNRSQDLKLNALLVNWATFSAIGLAGGAIVSTVFFRRKVPMAFYFAGIGGGFGIGSSTLCNWKSLLDFYDESVCRHIRELHKHWQKTKTN